MKKRLILFAVIILVLTGCQENESKSIIDVPSDLIIEDENNTLEISDSEPPITEDGLMVRLRTKGSEEYRDISFESDTSIDVPQKVGYTFCGYQDDQGVTYIDETGKFVREYHGTELLVLWAQFIPDEFNVLICKDNQQLEGFNKITCKYDADIQKDLPFGREILKDRKKDNTESCVIIGFANTDNEQIIFNDGKSVTPKSLGNLVNYEDKVLSLNIVTTDITYLWSCLDTRTISNDGFLKQKLGVEEYKYDTFSIKDQIDIDALKTLGYKKAILNFEISIDTENASPRIKILPQKASKNKDLKKNFIIDTGKIEKEDLDELGKYSKEYSVPIDNITGDFYIYYNSEGIFSKTWNSTSITVEIQFIK